MEFTDFRWRINFCNGRDWTTELVATRSGCCRGYGRAVAPVSGTVRPIVASILATAKTVSADLSKRRLFHREYRIYSHAIKS